MKKIKMLSTSLLIIIMLMIPYTAEASLQSRPGVKSLTINNYNVSDVGGEFFRLIKQMETASGPMGLNATVEIESSKVVETSSSNNIDVHMIKNTEWGTAAMLAASSYGNAPYGWFDDKIYDSTTQNESGIMEMAIGGNEIVAGFYTGSYSMLSKMESKYINVYQSSNAKESYFYGDATYETTGWKGALKSNFVSNDYKQFYRSGTGIFSVDVLYTKGSQGENFKGRAAIVCGQGF